MRLFITAVPGGGTFSQRTFSSCSMRCVKAGRKLDHSRQLKGGPSERFSLSRGCGRLRRPVNAAVTHCQLPLGELSGRPAAGPRGRQAPAGTTSPNFTVSMNCRNLANLPSRSSHKWTTGSFSAFPVNFPVPV